MQKLNIMTCLLTLNLVNEIGNTHPFNEQVSKILVRGHNLGTIHLT